MKTLIVVLFLTGLVSGKYVSLNFTVFGIGDSSIYILPPFDHTELEQRPQYVLHPSLNYQTPKLFHNYLGFSAQNIPYGSYHSTLNPFCPLTTLQTDFHRAPNYGTSVPLFFRLYNPANFNPYNFHFKNQYPGLINGVFAPQFYPNFRPQNYQHLSQIYESLLNPFCRLQNLALSLNSFSSSFKAKTFINLNNIRDGPVVVFIKDNQDSNKLVAIIVENGLKSLGKHQNTTPLEEALETGVGIKTAYLFNSNNIPVPSRKIPISRYIFPEEMTLGQLANLANQATTTPFLLLADNTSLVSEIQSSAPTFKIGNVEVTENSVHINLTLPIIPSSFQVVTDHQGPVILSSQTPVASSNQQTSESPVESSSSSSTPSSIYVHQPSSSENLNLPQTTPTSVVSEPNT